MEDVLFYKGKRIDKMSREELIDALTFAYNEIKVLMKEKSHERKFLMDLKGKYLSDKEKFNLL